ncbi:hypothetical protein LCGC14_1698860 [marine sediment metagenome]|uniref:Uncharacterized protein n=1 Tax=marine sediment metagenome TaxID=412755 RepID=A0A0F9HIC1_9ZZZZ
MNINKNIKKVNKIVNQELEYIDGIIMSIEKQLNQYREAIKSLMMQKRLTLNIRKKVA